MTTTAGPAAEQAAPALSRHSPRMRLVIVLAVVTTVVVAAGVITAVKIAFRYAHAAPLTCACGQMWGPAERTRDVIVGMQDSIIATARPGHAQTFYALLDNPSRVTQTILGLQSYDRESAEPLDFAVARPTGSMQLDLGDQLAQHYTTKPVALAPRGARWVRYTIHTSADGIWSPTRSEFWTELDLRVRVGAFTRIEQVSLDAQMVLDGR